MEPGGRTNIEFIGDPSDHFAVSYRQCSTEAPMPLQIQYSGKLHFTPYLGGCIYVSPSLGLNPRLRSAEHLTGWAPSRDGLAGVAGSCPLFFFVVEVKPRQRTGLLN